ncbi:hypothetical protein HK103_001650 [Boothiomyces macroporosus]|uniref:Uncharacterized protein n=1 Tax=Boothiomyces macroporosus TaxID=261099 RepID=A0AAD5Y4S4_9FUNG|nr:hypothetical protein HK103_001650 [Boothiomyces macroporosus]
MRDNYSGKWKENSQLSDSKEILFKLNEVPWLMQKAMKMVQMNVEITQSETELVISMNGGGSKKDEVFVFDGQERPVELQYGSPQLRKVHWEGDHLVVEQRSESKNFKFKTTWSIDGDVHIRNMVLTLPDGEEKLIKLVFDRVQ